MVCLSHHIRPCCYSESTPSTANMTLELLPALHIKLIIVSGNFITLTVVFQNQARFNLEEAQEVLLWIEQVTNVQFEADPNAMETAQDIADALKDGVQLGA